MPPAKPVDSIQLLGESLKTISEILMTTICLLFRAVALPLAGLVEVGALIAHRAENVGLPAQVSPSTGRIGLEV
jgi:hypothetical protein